MFFDARRALGVLRREGSGSWALVASGVPWRVVGSAETRLGKCASRSRRKAEDVVKKAKTSRLTKAADIML